jgi:hypothetical protein
MDDAQSPEKLAAEFGPRVQTIGRLLPMLEPWRNPTYLTRAWCLFELYTVRQAHYCHLYYYYTSLTHLVAYRSLEILKHVHCMKTPDC